MPANLANAADGRKTSGPPAPSSLCGVGLGSFGGDRRVGGHTRGRDGGPHDVISVFGGSQPQRHQRIAREGHPKHRGFQRHGQKSTRWTNGSQGSCSDEPDLKSSASGRTGAAFVRPRLACADVPGPRCCPDGRAPSPQPTPGAAIDPLFWACAPASGLAMRALLGWPRFSQGRGDPASRRYETPHGRRAR